MAWRVQQEEVRDLIDSDPQITVAPFIETANAVTDKISANDRNSVMTAALLKQVEMYLAAHFYEHRDPQFDSKKTGDAEANFQGKFDMGFDSSKWGQSAKRLDLTGTLAEMDAGGKKRIGGATWLGLPPSEQTDYIDRD